MKFSFVTGRIYGPTDQSIRVEVARDGDFNEGLADARIWFFDELRQIAGSFDTFIFESDRALDIQRSVMAAYDGSKYRTESLPAAGEARA